MTNFTNVKCLAGMLPIASFRRRSAAGQCAILGWWRSNKLDPESAAVGVEN
jgi:hypothetical protein